MKEIDISLLFEKPTFDKEAILWITPLAPLSMVVSMPGAYYRSQSEPSIYMLYGLFENMLGWHFSDEIRTEIKKSIKKKQSKKKEKFEFLEFQSEVGYFPILQNHIKIITPALFQPSKERFEDYWTQHMKADDERHLGGARNYSWELEQIINEAKTLDKQAKTEKDKDLKKELTEKVKEIKTKVMREFKDKMPKYYSSPKKREFVKLDGDYGYKLSLNEKLLEKLIYAENDNNSPTYLGTNEGWVNIKIQKL